MTPAGHPWASVGARTVVTQWRSGLSEMASLASLDADRSGKVDVAELLSAFDSDGSGGLDTKELDKLASYLSSQVRRHPASSSPPLSRPLCRCPACVAPHKLRFRTPKIGLCVHPLPRTSDWVAGVAAAWMCADANVCATRSDALVLCPALPSRVHCSCNTTTSC
jgi:hypothetical protein